MCCGGLLSVGLREVLLPCSFVSANCLSTRSLEGLADLRAQVRQHLIALP